MIYQLPIAQTLPFPLKSPEKTPTLSSLLQCFLLLLLLLLLLAVLPCSLSPSRFPFQGNKPLCWEFGVCVCSVLTLRGKFSITIHNFKQSWIGDKMGFFNLSSCSQCVNFLQMVLTETLKISRNGIYFELWYKYELGSQNECC